MAVTPYGRNKNHDDEIKNIAGSDSGIKNSGSDSKRQNFTNKTVNAAEAITICIKPLTHYLPRSDLKFGYLNHCHQEKQNAANFYIIENVW